MINTVFILLMIFLLSFDIHSSKSTMILQSTKKSMMITIENLFVYMSKEKNLDVCIILYTTHILEKKRENSLWTITTMLYLQM